MKKSTTPIRDTAMSKQLTPAQEAMAQELAQVITQASQQDLLDIARELIDTDDSTLFGNTEFKVRAIALKIAAKAYQQHLAQKKTATSVPA